LIANLLSVDGHASDFWLTMCPSWATLPLVSGHILAMVCQTTRIDSRTA
jgi:hypothetical protein